MVSYSCLLIDVGAICIIMAASLLFKICEATAYLKAIMEVYEKTFTGRGPHTFPLQVKYLPKVLINY